MKTYPIFYRFTERISGDGFWAFVELSGRALAVQEAEGEWWACGVNPGAIAGQGTTIREAFSDLQQAFRNYLEDSAKEFRTFAEFRSELERFFSESDAQTQAEWDAAVAIMRAGAEAPEHLAKEASEDVRCGITVREIASPKPFSGEGYGGVKVAA